MSTPNPFEVEVLQALREIKSDVSELKTSVQQIEKRLDTIDERFDTIDERFDSLDEKTDALWTLSNQSFSAISEVRNEVNPPWKNSRAFTAGTH